MSDERWQQIESVFVQAADLTGAAREAFLDRACEGDESLRQEVESLLAFDAPGEKLVDVPSLQEAEPDLTGQRIGPYRLIRLIGHGGMGAVYLGVRADDQFQKQVAIKLLKRGMDTDSMLNRFRQERQILANLEHPFIARLIDGGATTSGLPYFVMEYVDGVPITTYSKEKRLSVTERLRLFRMVCEAVQCAHQNLVVHRDVKPSNILTTNEGVPKLLDFGIAKMLGPEGPASETLTQRDQRMLTPDYASPEQVRGLPVSTATDIYSLGAVLYELLSGTRPHQFTSNSPVELEKIVCETEPEKPSAAVMRDVALPPAVRKQLNRELSGDLDNIILAAMRKEPQRRYASAAELSEDLRRHMESLPILAQEDRWLVRAGKFVRRHRVAVGVGVLVAASLVGGIVATTVQASRAERRFQMVRGLAKTVLFELHDDLQKLPGSTAVRLASIQTVVRYLDALAGDRSRDPALDLEMAVAYARVGNLEGHPFLSNLGRSGDALKSYQKALSMYERALDDPETRSAALSGLIDTELKSTQLESMLGNPRFAAAHAAKAAEYSRVALAEGRTDIPYSTQLNVLLRLADSEYDHGSTEGELKYYRNALALTERWVKAATNTESLGGLRDVHRSIGSALARGGDLYSALASLREAEKAMQRLHELPDFSESLRYNSINVLTSMGDLLAAPDDPNLGENKTAQTYYENALKQAERLAAIDLKNTNARRNVAVCYQRMGLILMETNPAEALSHYRKSLEVALEINAGDPNNAEYKYHSARAYMGIGESLRNLGRYPEAVENLSRVVTMQRALAAVSPERVWNLRAMSRSLTVMGDALSAKGDSEAALVTLREASAFADLQLQRAPGSLYHLVDRANALEAWGRHYVRESRRAGLTPARRLELQKEARQSFSESLAMWQSWTSRKVALPYSARREHEAAGAIAAIQ